MLRRSETGNIFLQLVAQQCSVASWNVLLHVLPPTWTTCRATIFYASCDNMLRKVDLASTFCNKFWVCCSYYHHRGNLPRNKSWKNACDWLVNFSRQLSARASVQSVNKHGGRRRRARQAKKVLVRSTLPLQHVSGRHLVCIDLQHNLPLTRNHSIGFIHTCRN